MTVCIGTFGAPEWRDLAYSRAIPSVPEDVRVIHRHANTLAQARNECLALVDTEFVIFCDADDELEKGYIEGMRIGKADLRAPSVRYDDEAPRVPRVVGHYHDCTGPCLEQGNWVAIGACVRTEILRSVGGFGEEPIWEDWAAWLRCYRAGATVEANPWAVYCAHTSESGRNASLTAAEKRQVFAEIAA